MTSELLLLLARIDAKRAMLDQRRPLNAGEAERLREYLDVEWTYHTNSIEGSTLTRQETLVVLKHGVTVGGKTLVEHLEATNRLHPVERAAHAHFWLVDIHPFIEGNGRVARLLMNLLLLRSGYPIAIIRTEDRMAYYAAFDAGHAGHLNDFLLLVAAAVDRTADLHLSATAGP